MEMMMNNDDDDDDEVDWLDLPLDLLSEIADKVTTSSSLEDYVRFGCICVQWRSFFIENKNYEEIKLSTLPVLLIPSFNHHHHHINYDDNGIVSNSNYYNPKDIWLGLDHNQRWYTKTRSFYSLSEKKVYDFQLQVPSNLHCRGSSHGWLFLVEECPDGTFPAHLFNPFRSSSSSSSSDKKKNKIQLPPLTCDDPIYYYPVRRSDYIKKVVICKDPLSSSSSKSLLLLSNPTTTTNIDDDNDFVVLGLYDDGKLGFCRPGDRAWTRFSISNRPIFDIICYKGQFWGVLQNGTAYAFDITPEPKVTLRLYPHQEDDPSPVSRYLVESAGDLFNVWRDYLFPDDDDNDDDYSTVGFHVFKLDQTTMEWSKTNTLDGRMFFLGLNASISLSPSDYFPGSCKPNSIYFTDDYEQHYKLSPGVAPPDIGVFNVEDGSLEPHYISESITIMPAPIWIQPML